MHTINNAPIELLRDYANYVEAKNEMDEIPFRFKEWQDLNAASAISFY